MRDAAIETENLTKVYPFGFLNLKKRTSLEGLNMEVQTGEVFGFIGPNGAGKSTTIKLLVRLIFPTAGSARILGKPISDVEMHRDIGYLPEQPYFYDYLTAAEVLDYFARFHNLTATDRKERVERMLKKVGLETARKIQLRKYSKGMLQRVGLAQAILHDPKLVILDEPMSGLDPVGRREVRDIILELKRDGKTVMFSNSFRVDGDEQRAVVDKSDTHGRLLPVASCRGRVVRGHRTIARSRSAHPLGVPGESDAGRVFHESGGGRPRAGSGSRGERAMRRAGVVALNTFREAVRDRVLYNLVFFALLMMVAAIAVGQISIGIEQTVIVSLGLSAISVIGLLIAVFIGVALVSKEMDKRTLYALLAKPVRRWEFLLGKFAGLLLTLAVNTAAMALGLLFVHRGFVHRRFVRAGAAEFAGQCDEPGDGGLHQMAFLFAAEF